MNAEFPNYEFRDGQVFRLNGQPVSVQSKGGTRYCLLTDWQGRRRYYPLTGKQVAATGLAPVSPEFPDYATDGDDIYRVASARRSVHRPRKIRPYLRSGRRMVQLINYIGERRWMNLDSVLDKSGGAQA